MNRLTPLIAALLLCACGSEPGTDAVTLGIRDSSIGDSGMHPSLPNTAEQTEAEPEKPQIALEKWSQPDLEHVRYQKVEDQTGCRWWMPFPGSEDENGPDPVLGRNHRPICRDSYQEPDAEIVYLDGDEAAKEIAAGTAVKATAAALKRAEGRDEEETGEAEAEKPEPAPTPSRTPSGRPIASMGSRIGRPLVTTRGGMATSMGNGLAMTGNGRLAIQVGGMAVPVHH